MTARRGKKEPKRINKGEVQKIVNPPSEARTIPYMNQNDK